MSKHTPGPWKVSSGDSLGIVDANGVYVSHSVGDFKDNLDEMLANAHLISAAPDMIEALSDLLAYFDGEIQGPAQRDGIIREARAAIAKATGES